jgi:hypothetical protein
MSSSGTKKSGRSPSSRGTKKHVRINTDKNQVLEFKRPFSENERSELWTTGTETQNAVNESMKDTENNIYKNKMPRTLRKAHAQNTILHVNKEVNTRKNLPKLAATIARGRFNLHDKENVETKTDNGIELKRSKSVSDLLVPPPAPLKRYQSHNIPIPRTPTKDKSKKEDYLKQPQQTMFERVFGFKSRRGGRRRKNKTRKTRKNRNAKK